MKKLIPVLFALVLILVLLPTQKAYADTRYCPYCKTDVETYFEVTFPGNCQESAIAVFYCCLCDEAISGNESIGTNPNIHVRIYIRGAVTATCKTEGYTGESYCPDCEETIAFSSSTGFNASNHEGPIEKDKTVVAATCKTEGVTADFCTACGKEIDGTRKNTGKDSNNHEGPYETRNASEGNCMKEAYGGDLYCSACNTLIASSTGVTLDPSSLPYAKHVGPTETRPVVNATCKTDGYTADYCLACGFEIANTRKNIGKDSSNHEGDTELRGVVTATCKTEGYTGDTYCLGCNTKIADGKSTGKNAGNHEGETEVRDAKAATCTAEGYTGDTWCLGCNTKIADGISIDRIAHTLVKTEKVDATCKEDGTEAYWTCSVCKKMFSDAEGTAEITKPTVIPSAGTAHKPGSPVKENVTYTCTKDGGYDEVVYCTVCKKELSRKHFDVKATGHDWQPYEYHVTLTRFYYICKNCGRTQWIHNKESLNMKPGLIRYANGDAVDYKASATGPDRDGVLTIMPIKHTERDNTDDISLYMTPDDIYVWVWEKMNKIELVRDGVTLALDPREITPEMFGLKEKEKPDYYVFTLTPSGKDGWLVKAEALIGEKRIPAEELKGITLTAAGKETEITANGVYKAE